MVWGWFIFIIKQILPPIGALYYIVIFGHFCLVTSSNESAVKLRWIHGEMKKALLYKNARIMFAMGSFKEHC